MCTLTQCECEGKIGRKINHQVEKCLKFHSSLCSDDDCCRQTYTYNVHYVFSILPIGIVIVVFTNSYEYRVHTFSSLVQLCCARAYPFGRLDNVYLLGRMNEPRVVTARQRKICTMPSTNQMVKKSEDLVSTSVRNAELISELNANGT